METDLIMELLRRSASGMSMEAISKLFGISKSTVHYYIDRINRSELTIEQATVLKPSELESLMGKKNHVRNGFHEPDFEHVYSLNMIRGRKHQSLKQLWLDYKARAPQGSRSLGYKGFCKAYARFCTNLPASCRQIQLINQWVYGNVAMIDYSGDGLCITKEQNSVKAQIFVGVLPASGYIFCYATARQTRDDWLDAQIKMLEYFDGVPREIYLDNSTSLVTKADKYQPQVCSQYKAFCDYYGTQPVPVRPGAPRDKAAVENAVKQVQASILNPLSSRQFFSLDELNLALGKELDKLNHRPLTNRTDGVSRYDLMREERVALLPLPTIPYEISSITKVLKVQKGNVVRFDNARYSVPLGYVGMKVRVIKSCRSGTVNIFDLETGELIWTHYLTSRSQQDIILPVHMPERIRAVMQTKEELVKSIGQAGPASKSLCDTLLSQNHGEIARKVLRGVERLRLSMGNALFEACCVATIKRSCPSYKILCDQALLMTANKDNKPQNHVIVDSADVRGAEYYEHLLNERTGEKP